MQNELEVYEMVARYVRSIRTGRKLEYVPGALKLEQKLAVDIEAMKAELAKQEQLQLAMRKSREPIAA